MGRRDGDVLVDTFGYNGLFELAGSIQFEEIASSQGEGHALVVGLQMIVDFGKDKGGKLSLGEGFILVEGLTSQLWSAAVRPSTGQRNGVIHLAQGACHLGPNGVDVVIEGLEGEDLEFGFLVS